MTGEIVEQLMCNSGVAGGELGMVVRVSSNVEEISETMLSLGSMEITTSTDCAIVAIESAAVTLLGEAWTTFSMALGS